MLPHRTFSLSCGAKPGNPSGCSFDLRGGGPPGLSRALEKELQGVPIHTAMIKPDRIHPRILFWTLCNSKSFLRCHLTSNSNTSKVRLLLDLLQASDHLPDPEKSSSATGPCCATWLGRCRSGSRQYDVGLLRLKRRGRPSLSACTAASQASPGLSAAGAAAAVRLGARTLMTSADRVGSVRQSVFVLGRVRG